MRTTKQTPKYALIPILFLGVMAVSTASLFIRFAQGEVPSIVIAFFRLAIATTILAPVALTRHREEITALRGRDIGLALLSGVFLAVHFAVWITSLRFTSIASSVVLVSTAPLWVALLAPLVLKERLARQTLIGMGLALSGGVIVSMSDVCKGGLGGFSCALGDGLFSGSALYGNLLALLGAIMAAFYVMLGRHIRPKLSLIGYVFVVYGAAAVVLLGVVFALGYPLDGYSGGAYFWMLLLGVIPQLFGHSTFNWALRYLPAAFISITLLGEPVGSTILAYLFLHETPTEVKLFGAILILGGILYASRSNTQP